MAGIDQNDWCKLVVNLSASVAQQDIVALAAPIELPGRFEELKELTHNGVV
jgi:hypothetical protein